jgi:hypothetical protein
MKRIMYLLIIGAASLTACSKCYNCAKGSSSTVEACFETASDAKQFKKNMENQGYDCRAVPER